MGKVGVVVKSDTGYGGVSGSVSVSVHRASLASLCSEVGSVIEIQWNKWCASVKIAI